MRVLVTGACGYFGSVLCPELEREGHEVTRFDLALGDDITRAGEVQKAAGGADLVVHLAAVVGLAAVSRDVNEALRVNVGGTENVCSCGARTVFGGILGGYPQGIHVDEETPVTPETPYYRQKLEAERLVLQARGDNISLRFGTMYGVSPAMRWHLLVHDFVRRALGEGCISIFQPQAMRPITNVRDAARAVLFFAERPEGGIYNVVSANLSKDRIARRVRLATGCRIVYTEGSDPEGRDYTVSSKKLESLGFEFRPDLENTIEDIIRVHKEGEKYGEP